MNTRRRNILSILDNALRWTGIPARVADEMSDAPSVDRKHRPLRWIPIWPAISPRTPDRTEAFPKWSRGYCELVGLPKGPKPRRLGRRAHPALTVDDRHIPLQSDHKSDHMVFGPFA